MVGWSDVGSLVEENCSSSACILNAIHGNGNIQMIAAAANFYNHHANSSFEVECKAKRDLWTAISRIEKDPAFLKDPALENELQSSGP